MRRAVVLVLMAVAAIAAGCGSDDDSTTTTPPAAAASTPAATSGGGAELALTAEEGGGLSFDPKDLSADAGEVTLTMANPDGNTMPHAVALEDDSGEVVQPGGTSTVSADLQPGTYTFFCPVGDHRQEGMEGTLTVK